MTAKDIADQLRPLLEPGQVVELRILGPHATEAAGYFADCDKLTSAALPYDGKFGCYWTLNPVNPKLRARAADRMERRPPTNSLTPDKEIARRRWLAIDCDPVRPAGISSSDAEHAAALDRTRAIRNWLSSYGWPLPIEADSGNGGHLLYRVDLPNDDDAKALLQRVLLAIDAQHSDGAVTIDTSVYNAARIWKLYGSLACKGDSTPDRPHRRARILDMPARLDVVPRAQLDGVAALAPELETAPANDAAGIVAWLERHGQTVTKTDTYNGMTRYRLAVCAFDAAHGKDSAVFIDKDGKLGWKCFHNGCRGRRWQDFRALLDPERADPISGGQPKAKRNGYAESVASVPALPAYSVLTEDMRDAGARVRAVWLDRWVKASTALAERTPPAFHLAMGIGLLCLIIARRVCLAAGPKYVYPVLNIVMVSRSTRYAKTTALGIVRNVVGMAGLHKAVLLPSSFTLPALVAELGLYVPANVRDGGPLLEADWLERHAHGAQRSILRDEVSGLLDDATKDYNAGLTPFLLKAADCPEYLDADLTLARGLTELQNVGISLVGGTTPAALRAHAAKPEHWHNGLFGRLALVAPDAPPRFAMWTDATMPAALVQDVRTLYDALPKPSADFDRVPVKDGETRIVGAHQLGYAAKAATLTKEARDAWERYEHALFDLAAGSVPERLDATYGRLPEMAAKVALTLATMEWSKARKSDAPIVVGIGHWAAAQEIVEHWRASAHTVLAEALRTEQEQQQASAADKLITILSKQSDGRMSRRDLLRATHWDAATLDDAIGAANGAVKRDKAQTAGRPSEWVGLTRDTSQDVTKVTKVPASGGEPTLVTADVTKGPAAPSGTPFSHISHTVAAPSANGATAHHWAVGDIVELLDQATGQYMYGPIRILDFDHDPDGTETATFGGGLPPWPIAHCRKPATTGVPGDWVVWEPQSDGWERVPPGAVPRQDLQYREHAGRMFARWKDEPAPEEDDDAAL